MTLAVIAQADFSVRKKKNHYIFWPLWSNILVASGGGHGEAPITSTIFVPVL